MLSDGVSASSAAFAVGYESVPQFNREYSRLFGLPPVRDVQTVRSNIAEGQRRGARRDRSDAAARK
jgi:AraC-like DNA-binding protein